MRTYSKQELQEFKSLILQKQEAAVNEYNSLMQHISDNSTRDTDPIWFNANHADELASKEELGLSAVRLKKFIAALSAALTRIENGTYGICIKTGELIPKERLRAVPHATLCLNAKLNENGNRAQKS
jgi:DnaK suppressor protein